MSESKVAKYSANDSISLNKHSSKTFRTSPMPLYPLILQVSDVFNTYSRIGLVNFLVIAGLGTPKCFETDKWCGEILLVIMLRSRYYEVKETTWMKVTPSKTNSDSMSIRFVCLYAWTVIRLTILSVARQTDVTISGSLFSFLWQFCFIFGQYRA